MSVHACIYVRECMRFFSVSVGVRELLVMHVCRCVFACVCVCVREWCLCVLQCMQVCGAQHIINI